MRGRGTAARIITYPSGSSRRRASGGEYRDRMGDERTGCISRRRCPVYHDNRGIYYSLPRFIIPVTGRSERDENVESK